MADKTIAFWNDWIAVAQDMNKKSKGITLFTLPQSGIVLTGNYNAVIDKYTNEAYPQETLTDEQQAQVADVYTNFVTELETTLKTLTNKKPTLQTNVPLSRMRKLLSGIQGVVDEHSNALLSQAPNAAAIKEQHAKLQKSFGEVAETFK